MKDKDSVFKVLKERNLHFDLMENKFGYWCVIVPELGAKVIAAGADDENVFWTSKEINTGEWCVGGLRTWLSPEMGEHGFFTDSIGKRHFVPPQIDPGSYEKKKQSENSITYVSNIFELQSASGEKFTIQLERNICIESHKNDVLGIHEGNISIEQKLFNRGTKLINQEIGLWSILQLPNENSGTILFALMPTQTRQRYSKEAFRKYFGDLPDENIRVHNNLIYYKASGGLKNKIGVSPSISNGLIGFIGKSGVMKDQYMWVIKSCKPEKDGIYLDSPINQLRNNENKGNGDLVQGYNHFTEGEKGFSEIECHGAASTIRPNECDRFTVNVYFGKNSISDIKMIFNNRGFGNISKERLY